jgi:3-oxoacyl-[acyl-carrier protein] reductase
MSKPMTSQRMLLTGCASGIGRYMAAYLLRQGHHVLATDIDLAALQAQAQSWPQERLLLRGLDVRDPQAWQTLVAEVVAQWGGLDVLMNIAGVIQPAYALEVSPQQVDLQVDVNLKGVIYGTQAAARQMTAQGGGQIITIASLAGLAPVPGISVYSASKFAVRAFCLAAAHELRPQGVYVSILCPDAVQTPMLDLQVPMDEAAMTFSGAATPLTVEQVGQALQSLLESKALEVSLPRSRGWLAKLASALPRAALWIEPLMASQGRRRQANARKQRP